MSRECEQSMCQILQDFGIPGEMLVEAVSAGVAIELGVPSSLSGGAEG
jgi:hypothetical protein